MFSKDALRIAAIPAAFLFIITFVLNLLLGSIGVLSSVFACIFYEIFAYITCWVFVLAKNRSDTALWANYIIWLLIANLGQVVSYFGI